MKNTIKLQDINELLDSFEKEHIDFILNDEFNGWNSWSILKKPLFYVLKSKTLHSTGPKKSVRKDSKINTLVKEISYVCQVFYWGFAKRNGDIIITSTGNKLGRDNNGLYTDVFVDPLVTSGAVKNYLYIENSSTEIGKRDSCIKAHLFHIGRPVTIALLHRYYLTKPVITEKSTLWANKLLLHFGKKNWGLDVPANEISDLLANFWAEYNWYKLLWSLNNPSRLFIVDGIPSGCIAAARKRKIPVWEFQHGFVFDNKPDYIISNRSLPVKQKMIIPDRICVFGNYFKDLLLYNGFWNQSEIISLGSYAIEKARESLHYESPLEKQNLCVIWTTQPSVFDLTQQFFNDLAGSNLDNVHFFIKSHPLESKRNLEWYKTFVANNASHFSMEPKTDFFQALRGKHILIGFYSTTLLEALSLGYPVITIAAGQFDKGINNVLIHDLSHVLKPVSNVAQLLQVINDLKGKKEISEKWCKESLQEGNYIFDGNYFQNLKHIFN